MVNIIVKTNKNTCMHACAHAHAQILMVMVNILMIWYTSCISTHVLVMQLYELDTYHQYITCIYAYIHISWHLNSDPSYRNGVLSSLYTQKRISGYHFKSPRTVNKAITAFNPLILVVSEANVPFEMTDKFMVSQWYLIMISFVYFIYLKCWTAYNMVTFPVQLI